MFSIRKPNTAYRVECADAGTPWSEIYALFALPKEWADLLDWPEDDDGVGRLEVSDPARLEEIEAAFLLAAEAWASLRPNRSALAINALERVILLLDEVNPRHLHRPYDPRIVRVLEYIRHHYREPLEVAALAQVACLSPSRFADLFRKQVGLSPMQQVEVQRLKMAAEELLETTRTIEEIAFASGFENSSHFSTRFRRHYGMPPRDYRQTPSIPLRNQA